MNFRYVVRDSVVLPGRTIEAGETFTLFDAQPQPLSGDAQVDIPESALTNTLFSDPSIRQLFLDELRLPRESDIFPELSGELGLCSGTKPGDLDILAVSDPDQSVAIECKRVKVVVERNGEERITKRNGLKKAALQAKGLVKLGFHRVYVLMFVVTECRLSAAPNVFSKGPSDRALSELARLAADCGDVSDYGILLAPVTQFSNLDIALSGGVGVGTLRPARPRAQSWALSERISRLESTLRLT